MLPRTRAPLIAFIAAGFCLAALMAASLWLGVGRDSGQTVTIGGPFNLVNHRGQPITNRSFVGKPTLYFFGFTHCPEVCPTTLQDMTSLLTALGPDGDRVNVVFVSVDPERDTPDFLATYLANFDSRIVGATGSVAQVADMAKAFRVYYKKIDEGESYTIDHTAAIYLMDANGEFATIINYQEDQQSALKKVRRFL